METKLIRVGESEYDFLTRISSKKMTYSDAVKMLQKLYELYENCKTKGIDVANG